MNNRYSRQNHGFTLIELLLVLIIVGILAVIGVASLGFNRASAVRTVMDEVEGTLTAAQKLSVATGNDVLVVTSGEWSPPPSSQLKMTYGAVTPGDPTPATTVWNAGANASSTFRVATHGASLEREHMYAGVVTVTNNTWWATSATGSTAITAVDPFKAGDVFSGIQTDANNIFQGGTATNSIRISGADKRFMTTFWIGVVGLVGGQPVKGGPMGLLVVAANGGQIYKFYNPGLLDGGNGTWRRI